MHSKYALVLVGIEAPNFGVSPRSVRAAGGALYVGFAQHTQNLTICLLAIWLRRLILWSVSPLERFATNLKTVRKERGWSQEDLSYHSKLHTTAISKMECANRAPRFPTIVILAEALQVPAGRLFEGIPAQKRR